MGREIPDVAVLQPLKTFAALNYLKEKIIQITKYKFNVVSSMYLGRPLDKMGFRVSLKEFCKPLPFFVYL